MKKSLKSGNSLKEKQGKNLKDFVYTNPGLEPRLPQ